jgi:hypothetical protein
MQSIRRVVEFYDHFGEKLRNEEMVRSINRESPSRETDSTLNWPISTQPSPSDPIYTIQFPEE